MFMWYIKRKKVVLLHCCWQFWRLRLLCLRYVRVPARVWEVLDKLERDLFCASKATTSHFSCGEGMEWLWKKSGMFWLRDMNNSAVCPANGYVYSVGGSLEKVLNWTEDRYDNPEIIVTENGYGKWSSNGVIVPPRLSGRRRRFVSIFKEFISWGFHCAIRFSGTLWGF